MLSSEFEGSYTRLQNAFKNHNNLLKITLLDNNISAEGIDAQVTN